MSDALTLTPTLGIIAAMVAALVGLILLERRPREFGKLRFPTTPFFFLALMVIVVMAAHLLTLFGAHAGPRY